MLNLNQLFVPLSQFGHGLQHMLTTVKYSEAAGTNNIEWDAVICYVVLYFT